MNFFKLKCDESYFNGCPIIDDDSYDALFGDVETEISTETMVDLPVWMGSLNKVRTDKAIKLWQDKQTDNKLIISEKLDGISALYRSGQLYSRGKGMKGKNLTQFLSDLNLPKCETFVRGELIMSKTEFSKHQNVYCNARNLVAGIFNRKTVESSLVKEIEFIAYELIDEQQLKISEQFEELKRMGFKTPQYRYYNNHNELTVDLLNKILSEMKDKSNFNIDGVVLCSDNECERNTFGNPKYMCAFKPEPNEVKIANVSSIEWPLSRYNFFIPVVVLDPPVLLNGVKITRTSGKNARYIQANSLGKGAQILISRSGDTIPEIVKVITPGTNFSVTDFPKHVWKGVNICPVENEDKMNEIKQIANLLKGLDVKNISVKTVEKLFKQCKLTSFFDMISATEKDISVFGDKTKQLILSEFQKIKTIKFSAAKLVSASSVLGYGIGEKRVNMLFESITNFDTTRPQMVDICNTSGFSEILASQIIDNHAKMVNFLETCKQVGIHVAPVTTDKKIHIAISGFRRVFSDKFTVHESVTDQCEYLVVEDKLLLTRPTQKIIQAQKKGIPIISLEDLRDIEHKMV